MQNKLKKCPLCGNEAELIISGETFADESYKVFPTISCKKCGLVLAGQEHDYARDISEFELNKLAQMWNTRINDDEETSG